MSIEKNTKKNIENIVGSIFKDDEGFFVVREYDKQNDCYICYDYYFLDNFEELEFFETGIYLLKMEDFAFLNAKLVRCIY